MPTAEEILAGLTRIANRAFPLAVGWHLAIGVAVVALLIGWRPSRRAAALLVALPVASVSALAFASGNPFNGGIFALVFAILIAAALRFDVEPVEAGPRWAIVAGGMLVAFGAFYPHFLEGRRPLAYLYGAPVGLLPCPTLSLVVGFTLVAGGFSSRAWILVLVSSGVFYGALGSGQLGVTLDLVLFAGSLFLLALPDVRFATRGRQTRRPAASPPDPRGS